jgi:hypothetical protein
VLGKVKEGSDMAMVSLNCGECGQEEAVRFPATVTSGDRPCGNCGESVSIGEVFLSFPWCQACGVELCDCECDPVCDVCGGKYPAEGVICESCGDVKERAGWWADPEDWAITVERAAAYYDRRTRSDLAGVLVAYGESLRGGCDHA